MAEDPCVCYKLSGVSWDHTAILYFGYVKVLPWQTLPEACTWRLQTHVKSLKYCIADLKPPSMSKQHLGTRIPESKALVMEAVYTICAWAQHREDDSIRVRGGPYVLKSFPTAEASLLEPIAAEGSWESRALKLEEICCGLPAHSLIRRHLKQECFKCGKANWKLCGCKIGKAALWPQPSVANSSLTPAPALWKSSLGLSSGLLLPVKASSSSTSSASSAFLLPVKKGGRGPKGRSGSRMSGSRSYSGKSLCGNKSRKRLGVRSPSQTYINLKWGNRGLKAAADASWNYDNSLKKKPAAAFKKKPGTK